jgi:uncharacterized membrane protein (DUF106 family)
MERVFFLLIILIVPYICSEICQITEYKKRVDEEASAANAVEEIKKKMAWDMKQLEQKVATLMDENDKLNKSKKKLMSEVAFAICFLSESMILCFPHN